jgi:hypothetical protein
LSRHIFTPTTNGAADWQKLLAAPEKHWRTGFSAKSLAYCWEKADGFPPEVALLFSQSNIPAFQHVELLLAFPEHKVIMPPRGGHPSQNDLFVLAKASDGQLIAITIEGKVSESFGPALGEWRAEASRGKTKRLIFIKEQLGLTGELPTHIRYQLFHRTVSAIIEASRFNAPNAAMIVHSFNQSDLWFHDYQNFLALFGAQASEPGKLFFLKETHGIKLYSGWAHGNEKFLQV